MAQQQRLHHKANMSWYNCSSRASAAAQGCCPCSAQDTIRPCNPDNLQACDSLQADKAQPQKVLAASRMEHMLHCLIADRHITAVADCVL